jgi:hypothetical protein
MAQDAKKAKKASMKTSSSGGTSTSSVFPIVLDAAGISTQIAGAALANAFDQAGLAASRRARRAQYRQRIEQLLDANTQQREESSRLSGRQRAAFGAAGVRSTTGTARAVQEETLEDAILNQNRILKGVRALREQIRREHREGKRQKSAATIGTIVNIAGIAIGGLAGGPAGAAIGGALTSGGGE